VLDTVRGGRFAEPALAETLDARGLPREDRALATELVYGVLRWRLRLDAVIDRLLDKPDRKFPSLLSDILRIALYQLLLLDRIPSHAAVNEAVIQAKGRFPGREGFVNAILRRALRDVETLDQSPGDDPESLSSYYSHPLWLVERWMDELGPEATRAVLEFNNSRAPLIVRVNRIKIDPDGLLDLFSQEGVRAARSLRDPDALTITSSGGPVYEMPGFRQGLFAVQERASQMIAPLLGAIAGERILDACAAPGGKTAHLAALLDNALSLTAMDSDPPRLRETKKNLKRLGVTGVEAKRGDARDEGVISELGLFDRILVDAPCTNLGVLRHNPEVKYRIRPEDPAASADRQIQILRATSKALKSGGTLLYSVCTVSREETDEVIRQFLAESPDYALSPIRPEEVSLQHAVDPDGFLRTFPPRGEETDGFFAARMKRG
jgi:16S rRNA (cytosine967-C5)-methyltransferase